MKNSLPIASIKTDIFEFCQTYAGILKPFVAALDTARADIQGKGDAETLQRPMAGFSDVLHRMDSLLHKVEEQQAYLIIFGPLKSGKSTLMNAISAAYVSEVTSLPAYPCLVHVKHGDECSFVATRYSGEKLKFADNAGLQAVIRQSHETLAERLREVEDRGETFDPGVHYPDAIRRVDVALPTRNLKDSLTVLVDTPGLYTRMKFGYDLMTREFRNSAACAVFVVKTDNLFLEQVFVEFNDLLDLFSRIFIVVNIDSNKRDLSADGTLQPSLESKSPGEVIRAFESLVMSAPLRRAQEAGRLKIYPIDLLNSAAAAMRLAAEPPTNEDAPAETAAIGEETAPDAGEPDAAPTPPQGPAAAAGGLATLSPLPTPAAPHEAAEPDLTEMPAGEADTAPETDDGKTSAMPAGWTDHPEASFALFLKDLTDYLNSNDYLHEFMGDALLMGTNLGAEIQEHCSQDSTAALEVRQQEHEAELRRTVARLAAIGKLEALNLKDAFVHIRNELQKHVIDVAVAAANEARQKALNQLEQWFDSDLSVAALQREWAAILANCGKRVAGECHLKVRALVSSPLGGIRIDDSLRALTPGLDEMLEPAVASARGALDGNAPVLLTNPFQIEPENLKVRKSLWDWLAFRSLAVVRRRLFGPPDEMDREVSISIKEKRLGLEGRQALEERILGELARQFPSEALRVSESSFTRYIDMYGKALRETLRAGRDSNAARKDALEQRIEENLTIIRTLAELTRESEAVLAEIAALGRKYRSYSRVITEVEAIVADDTEAAAETSDDAEIADTPDEAEVADAPDEAGAVETPDETGADEKPIGEQREPLAILLDPRPDREPDDCGCGKAKEETGIGCGT